MQSNRNLHHLNIVIILITGLASNFGFANIAESAINTIKEGAVSSSTTQNIAQNPQQETDITDAVYLKNDGFEDLRSARWEEAVSKFQKALALFRKWGFKGGEAASLNHLGDAYFRVEKYAEAISYFNQAMAIYQRIARPNTDDAVYIGFTWQYLGDVYDKKQDFTKAIDGYNQALNIFRVTQKLPPSQLSNTDLSALQVSESITLSRLASIYFKIARYDEALTSYQGMLPLYEKNQDKIGLAQTWNNIGVIYASQSRYGEALEAYNKSLVLVRDLCCFKGDEAAILNNLSTLYFSLGQNKRALNYADEAAKIYQKLGTDQYANLQKKEVEFLFDALSNDNISPSFVNRGLATRNNLNDSYRTDTTVQWGAAANFNNLGQLYTNIGKYNDAITMHQRALEIYSQIKNSLGTGITLDYLGNAYSSLGQPDKALSFHQQALAVYRNRQDKNGMIISLNNLGKTYVNLGKIPEALGTYQQGLALLQELGDNADGNTRAVLLHNIGDLLIQQKQIPAGIAFLKYGVNMREASRKNLRLLPREDRTAYRLSVAYGYRQLAVLLLQQGRVLEGVKVLDLLKVQELQNYLRDVGGNDISAQGIELLELEKFLLTVDLNQWAKPQPASFLLEKQQQIQREAPQASLKLSSSQRLLSNLQQFGTGAALLYPILLEDQLMIALVPLQGLPVVRTVKVTDQVMQRQLMDFRADLQDTSSADVKISGKKLYERIIAPIESDLAAAKVTTLLYAPDGQMRYIPLSALYDGQQWLVERYGLTYLTAASFMSVPNRVSNSLNNSPSNSPSNSPNSGGNLNVIAAAFTEGKVNITVGQQQFSFSGLPFAGQEVANIANQIPNTTKLLDQSFTQDQAVNRFGEFKIVHLATHAAFVSGRPEDSFIVLGNGAYVSLRDLRNWKLPNTELVVLSACQTALGGMFSGGEEILGFGYQMQRTGAKAAIASLWAVSDQGTQFLMERFYRQMGTESPNALQRIVMLREAQLQVLRNEDRRFRHPYFWSAFILIGN